MVEHRIRLPRGEWTFDDAAPLGKAGGFGEVFRGDGIDGPVAVKRLKLTATEAAHRELGIGEELLKRQLKHVVPVLDVGQDAQSDRYYLVMPICNLSLQEAIDGAPGNLAADFIAAATLNIVVGLLEVHDLAHRDLKPGNVLLHEGTWKIADFGIANFVEDATSLQTLRTSLTPSFAAPEQWRGERPTSATDVYALGCIIHALVTGKPPFVGSLHDIREAHLSGTPARLTSVSHRWATFVTQMLRKLPSARPTLSRCEEALSKSPVAATASSLAEPFGIAAQRIGEETAQREVDALRTRELEAKRTALFEHATSMLLEIRGRFEATIKNHTEDASFEGATPYTIRFGPARLEFLNLDAQINYREGPDVIVSSSAVLTCNRLPRPPYVRSATMFYADLSNGRGYRWYEAAFWRWGGHANEPVGLSPLRDDFYLALKGTHNWRLAYGPLAIDDEDEQTFSDRWLRWLGKAAVGELEEPRRFPFAVDDL